MVRAGCTTATGCPQGRGSWRRRPQPVPGFFVRLVPSLSVSPTSPSLAPCGTLNRSASLCKSLVGGKGSAWVVEVFVFVIVSLFFANLTNSSSRCQLANTTTISHWPWPNSSRDLLAAGLHPSGRTTVMHSTETIVMQLVFYVGTNGAKKDKKIYFNFWGLQLQNVIKVKYNIL